MALDAAIRNVGDFYSAHYLDALLAEDLKAVRAAWVNPETGKLSKDSPPRRLAALTASYFRAKGQARNAYRPDLRYEASADIQREIIEALGYAASSVHPIPLERPAKGTHTTAAERSEVLPVLARIRRSAGEYLWIVEGRFLFEDVPEGDEDGSSDDLFDASLTSVQACQEGGESLSLPGDPLRDLLTRCFRQDDPPRWVITVGGGDLRLAERGKWSEGRWLAFDLDQLFSRKDLKGFEVAAALLSKETLAPDDGMVLHDRLDESSHKHAFQVSEDLKYSVREAVELLANEWVHYQRTVKKEKIYRPEIASDLSSECLRYLYRLLFLFFAEARGDSLGVVPGLDSLYMKGYSLDCLRELEQTPLTTEEARNGYFFHHTLSRLFEMLHDGYSPGGPTLDLGTGEGDAWEGFRIPGLGGRLFDPRATPLLGSIRIRNLTLQQVIEKLSLTRPKRNQRRGRISYAQLGINQLGAVYEGLLSYRGFFAEEKVWAVKEAGASVHDEKTQLYFVPEADLAKYRQEELLYVDAETGEPVDLGKNKRGRGPDRKLIPRTWEQGDFVFHLAGRDRQKSASYYTPEVLTEAVVRYALKERYPIEKRGEAWTADDLLAAALCEPAMGSGAFLNEAINQLADLYLKTKQKELGQDIEPDRYQEELQKVKAHLAVNCCYGVDLNPVAVELAEVSLWLNSVAPGQPAPWFGMHLKAGNSLIGARRAVYPVARLQQGKKAERWDRFAPQELRWDEARPAGTVYHFLVPDGGMASYEGNKAVKALAGPALDRIRAWKKEFLKPFSSKELRLLKRCSEGFETLLKKLTKQRLAAEKLLRARIPVFGTDTRTFSWPPNPEDVRAGLEQPDGPYRRLKLALDAWCALWFWPIDQADQLPTRATWLKSLSILLTGRIPEEHEAGATMLFPGTTEVRPDLFETDEYGQVNVENVLREILWLRVVREISIQQRFHHWHLEFPEVFEAKGGFDLILGNPPWVLVSFDEAGVLADFEPRIAVRKHSAKKVADIALHLLKSMEIEQVYFCEYAEQTGIREFLGSTAVYPLLQGMKSNLYKCFVTKAWEIGGPNGVSGYLHPEGVYDDPGGGNLRDSLYRRLRLHCQFINELSLFAEVDHHSKYSVNVSLALAQTNPDFRHMSNLYHPSTIAQSMEHPGLGPVPGIKDEDNRWELRPHRRRLVRVEKDRLDVFARLYDSPGTTPGQASLPVVHSEEIANVLEKLAEQPHRLGDLAGKYFATKYWNETDAQKNGTIRRETRYPVSPAEWILSGPHFYVGTPLAKTPNENCSNNLDYSSIDLTAIPADYLPRTNYVPACSPEEYQRRTPKWNGRPVTDFHRFTHRKMLSPTGERTLIGILLPSGPSHVLTAHSIAFESRETLLVFSGLASSLVYDFFLKTTGKNDLLGHGVDIFPLPNCHNLSPLLARRTLLLNSLTTAYSDLWETSTELVDTGSDMWTRTDPRIRNRGEWISHWSPDSPLRADLERRQALVELDALSALALGLTEEELITIYRVQFPVLQQYERTNRYDQTGRLVPRDVLKLAESNNIDIHAPLSLSTYSGPADIVGEVDTPGLGVTGGIRWEDPKMEPRRSRIYPPPFTTCDREADMRQAYRAFLERLGMPEPT